MTIENNLNSETSSLTVDSNNDSSVSSNNSGNVQSVIGVTPISPADPPNSVSENFLLSIETIAEAVIPVFAAEPCRFLVSDCSCSPSYSAVGFINQGNTTLLECRMQACHLLSLGAWPIDVIYNPSVLGWESSRSSNLEMAVILLRWSWDAYFARTSSRESLRLQFCAGGGAHIVRAALVGYPYAARIFVVAIAPSCMINPNSCFRVRHYRTVYDVTSMVRGPGSAFPHFTLLERESESRGLFGYAMHDPSFDDILALERACFEMREQLQMFGMLTHAFDSQVQGLRERFLDRVSFAQQVDNSEEAVAAFWRSLEFGDSTGNITRRCILNEFIVVNYGPDLRIVAENNLCTAALDEFPLDREASTAVAHNLIRDISLLITEIALVMIRNLSLSSVIGHGAPLLQSIGIFSSLGAYVVRRDFTRNSCSLRILALRGGSIGFFVSCFRLCLFSGLSSSSALANISRRSCIVISSSCLFVDVMFRCYAPLRDRVQRRWTIVSDSYLMSSRYQNSEATRVGIVNRIVGSMMQIGTGSAILFGMGGLLGAIVAPVLSTGSLTGSNFRRLMVLISITGCFSITSVIANIRLTRRLFRGLYNYDHTRVEMGIVELREGGLDMSPENDDVFFDDSSVDQ
ncbi:MAG: DUF687 family protein [Victivallaceae bacterium]